MNAGVEGALKMRSSGPLSGRLAHLEGEDRGAILVCGPQIGRSPSEHVPVTMGSIHWFGSLFSK